MNRNASTRKSRRIRIASLLLTLVMLFSALSLSSLAAVSGIYADISNTACKGNASAYAFPDADDIIVNSVHHFNLAATTDFKLDRMELYVCYPGQNTYYLLTTYNPSGWFRWYTMDIRFTVTGTHYLKILLWDLSGNSYTGILQCDVLAASAAPAATGNTYLLNNQTYSVVPHLKSDYFFNQKDYPRFNNRRGWNVGCTATAMAMAYSISHDSTLSPNDVSWSSYGTSWEYATQFVDGNRRYSAYSYTQAQALQAIYRCVNSGKPMILGVTGAGCDHVVVAVGYRSGADYNNLSLSDILIIDPNGGYARQLSDYTGIDTGWSLRVPIN